jgi:hypothetical protein
MNQFEMLLLREYEIVDTQQLRAYEQLWINRLNPVNTANPFNPISIHLIRKNRRQKAHVWYQMNKHEFNRTWICECGSNISKNSQARHNQSKKHQKHVDSMNRKKREATSNKHQIIDLLIDKVHINM